MNIGFYLENTSNEKQMSYTIDVIEYGIENNLVDDASVFYNSISFSHFEMPCGTFNSTDIWNFSGKLLLFSMDCLVTSLNIVNNIELYYLYGWEKQKNILTLLNIMSKRKLNIVTTNKEDAEEVYRLTGQHSINCEDHQQLITKIQS